jgi:hypothetical protein
LIKLFLIYDRKLAFLTNDFGDSSVHFFAEANAPLSLLALLKETDGKTLYNGFGNSPIHEALLINNMNATLLLL